MTTSVRSNFRWVICGLLFFAATINYIDRQVIGILKTTLQKELVFDERAYAAIVFSFQAAYAVGMLLSGRIMDRIGVRVGQPHRINHAVLVLRYPRGGDFDCH